MPLGGFEIKRQWTNAAATFLCSRLLSFMRKEMLARGQQETAEPTFRRCRLAYEFCFQQMGEEALRQIASLVPVSRPPADVSIERIPIAFAEYGERFAGVRLAPLAGGEND